MWPPEDLWTRKAQARVLLQQRMSQILLCHRLRPSYWQEQSSLLNPRFAVVRWRSIRPVPLNHRGRLQQCPSSSLMAVAGDRENFGNIPTASSNCIGSLTKALELVLSDDKRKDGELSED